MDGDLRWAADLGPPHYSVIYDWLLTQVESFEVPLVVQSLPRPDRPFQGVFIRAPVLPPFLLVRPIN